MNADSPRVVVLTHGFPPAFRIGGPARSLGAMTSLLEPAFSFRVITSAYDQGPELDVVADAWTRSYGATVYYCSTSRQRPWSIWRLISQTNPDVVYLNSLFDVRFSIIPLTLSRIFLKRWPILVAPRGELSLGALGHRRHKKAAFLRLYRLLRIHQWISWHASTELESRDIIRVFGNRVSIYLARDLTVETDVPLHEPAVPPGHESRTSLVFLSRIVPKKNLDGLLRALAIVDVPMSLTIAGPIEDKNYWSACSELIECLPPTITVSKQGIVTPDEVVPFLSGFDLFVLPTHGENFGHVILEALIAGVPVIAGRETPWSAIQAKGAGWMCDSNDIDALVDLLREFDSMPLAARNAMRNAARQLGLDAVHDESAISDTRDMLNDLARARNA